MNKQMFINNILKEIKHMQYDIPIGVSARHCHLNAGALHRLFGEGYRLRKKKPLYQPGQFAAMETVTLVGPKGCIENVRILGPNRKFTQVEVSRTDTIKLGIGAPVRESGQISDSAPVTIVGPKGSIYLKEGLIVAKAHIHMSPKDAEQFNVKDGDYVTVAMSGRERTLRLGKVLIRVSPNYRLEMHIDTDEANAALVTSEQKGKIIEIGEKSDE